MASPLLDLLIHHYLREPKNPVGQTKLRQYVKEAVPPLTHRTVAQLMRSLPKNVGVSFINSADSIGVRTNSKAPDAAIVWAQMITALLGRIPDKAQDDIIMKYSKIPSQLVTPSKILPGLMYTYKYEAATTNDYDLYPMMLCLSRTNDSILGMNFHYLPYKFRFVLFEAMMPLIVPVPVNVLSRIYITYKRLTLSARYKGYGATIKRYNLPQFKTNAVLISPLEWAVALAFPSHLFQGDTVHQVWSDSIANHYYGI